MGDFKYTGQVDKNASPELKQALDDMAKKAYDMQTNPLTKTEAALLYGYGYRLVDAAGTVFSLASVQDDAFIAYNELGYGYDMEIQFNDVGKSYFVLVHPLSRLTTEIEATGELFPFVPKNTLESYGYYVNENPIVENLSSIVVEQLKAWHFDCANFLERGIGKEITV